MSKKLDLLGFAELKDFLVSRMRLSHIYQPLLIRSLIDCGGAATIRQLATMFLGYDESQILYYEKRLKERPVRVLGRHGVVSSDGTLVRLMVGKLTLEQRAELKRICEEKIQEYIKSRGIGIWDYRLLDQSTVPDLLRYRVLSESGGRCALCGVTKDEQPLDVDHIIPRSLGGKTVYENLQVLCAKCNRSKGNRDATDFRKTHSQERPEGCEFCQAAQSDRVLMDNGHAFAIPDLHPVTTGHTLVIPRRHFTEFFDISSTENAAVFDLLRVMRKRLLGDDAGIQGFNIGVNAGTVAGHDDSTLPCTPDPPKVGGYRQSQGWCPWRDSGHESVLTGGGAGATTSTR